MTNDIYDLTAVIPLHITTSNQYYCNRCRSSLGSDIMNVEFHTPQRCNTVLEVKIAKLQEDRSDIEQSIQNLLKILHE